MGLDAWQSRPLVLPQDVRRYLRHKRSRLAAADLDDGLYVYVVDAAGDVYVLVDGPHRHPKVLGNREPARYAGDMSIANQEVIDLTNLSGTFQFVDEEGLLLTALQLESQGLRIRPGSVRFFPADGGRPKILR